MTLATEPHYTTAQVAEMLNLRPRTVHKLFIDEPGVLALRSPRLKSTRPYVTLRIPKSVLERWHEQRSGGFGLERKR